MCVVNHEIIKHKNNYILCFSITDGSQEYYYKTVLNKRPKKKHLRAIYLDVMKRNKERMKFTPLYDDMIKAGW